MNSSSAKLVELLNQATNPSKNELDVSAVDGFCYLLRNEPVFIREATEKLAIKIQSPNKSESLFALDILEEAMNTCGEEFRTKVGKFHFLNEMIKVVSKNHMGNQTDEEVRNRILDLLFMWTKNYPKETKIKEAYDMLKTQGIIHQPVKNIKTNMQVVNQNTAVATNRAIDKNSEMLKRLCNSKNPKDIEEANLWIQNMVREEARQNEIKNKRLLELNKITELIELLDSMVDSYCPGETTQDELETIEEQYLACKKTPATIHRLAEETQHSEGMLDKILQTGVKIQEVLQKYETVIGEGKVAAVVSKTTVFKKNSGDLMTELLDVTAPTSSETNLPSDGTLNDLSDVFGLENASSSTSAVKCNSDVLIPQPLVTTAAPKYEANYIADLLGSINNKSEKSHTNILTSSVSHPGKPVTQPSVEKKSDNIHKFAADIDSLVLGMRSSLLPSTDAMVPVENGGNDSADEKLLNIENEKSCLFDDHSDDQMLITSDETITVEAYAAPESNAKPKSLADIHIDLDSIEPSSLPSRIVLDEPKGLKIVINFTKDRPRPDVTVIVVSTTNEGPECISDYQFDAAVKKPCKVRLLAASGRLLPGTKPFRPPADGITQVLLLSNPTDQPTNLVCIFSYCVGDDPDPTRETREVKNIPLQCN